MSSARRRRSSSAWSSLACTRPKQHSARSSTPAAASWALTTCVSRAGTPPSACSCAGLCRDGCPGAPTPCCSSSDWQLTRSLQAGDALEQGKRVYASGERAAALKLFESALRTMARAWCLLAATAFPCTLTAPPTGPAHGAPSRAAVQLQLLPRCFRRRGQRVDLSPRCGAAPPPPSFTPTRSLILPPC